MDVLLVYCSCPPDAADGLVQALLQERLVACASVLPAMRSHYRWQGRLEQADEALLLLKTTTAAYPALESRLQALHPYEVPEILAVAASAGLPAYLAWVRGETI